jgi:uncharacterized protein YbjT (DUF2867 family)
MVFHFTAIARNLITIVLKFVKGYVMKIVVIGGGGLVGKKLVTKLRERGHEALAASPSSGVNAVTGAGLAHALSGAEVVVDASNSPSFEEAAVLEFFETSTRNLLAAEADAGVNHHLVVSIVGADRIPDSGYLRAKVAQEKLIRSAGIPYTIVRATQFFEFVGKIIAQFPTDGQTVRVPLPVSSPSWRTTLLSCWSISHWAHQ